VTYNPREYWRDKPADPVKRVHGRQEAALLDAVADLTPTSILEVGVGTGRIASLLTTKWPDATYTGIDLSPARLAYARKTLPGHVELIETDLLDWEPDHFCDLVIAVEVLMHIRPSDLDYAMERLRVWSRQAIVTVDWTEPIEGPIGPWNFLHDYAAHGLRVVSKVDLQSVHRWDWW